MREHTTPDEQFVEDAIRQAFPQNAGLSADKTRRLHARLKASMPVRSTSLGRTPIAVAGVALALTAAVSGYAVYAAIPSPVPTPTVADRYDAKYAETSAVSPRTPAGMSVPALALGAISEPNQVLHFTSEAETLVGPGAGKSTEEMWYDPQSGAGRLVRRETAVDGVAVTTTIVSDGTLASVTTKRSGESSVTEPADMNGRLGRSFDKLATYRKMLESRAATVTGEGRRDGVKTYRLRAVVDAFGGAEMRVVMEAEIRAEDYLPISCRSGFVDSDGRSLPLRTRTFSEFDRVEPSSLPKDWFVPWMDGSRGAANAPDAVYF